MTCQYSPDSIGNYVTSKVRNTKDPLGFLEHVTCPRKPVQFYVRLEAGSKEGGKQSMGSKRYTVENIINKLREAEISRKTLPRDD